MQNHGRSVQKLRHKGMGPRLTGNNSGFPLSNPPQNAEPATKRPQSANTASTHSIPKNGPGVAGKRFSTDDSANPMSSTSSSHNDLEVPGAPDKANLAYDSL